MPQTSTVKTVSSPISSPSTKLHPSSNIPLYISNHSLHNSSNHSSTIISFLTNTIMRKTDSISFKLLIKKLQNHLQSKKVEIFRGFECFEEEDKDKVPDDVKEGQFAVLAAKNEEEKPIRFVVELCVLRHPAFLGLLKMAEEEYGFQQKGALAVPCRPEELRRILKEMTWS